MKSRGPRCHTKFPVLHGAACDPSQWANVRYSAKLKKEGNLPARPRAPGAAAFAAFRVSASPLPVCITLRYAHCCRGRGSQAKMKNWSVRKIVVPPEAMPEEHRLKKSLSWPHLVALGVGAIVGTGILTLIGVGAGKAGPAVILSFAIAGVICACAALAYAEVATMIPASGSAYTYSYAVFGELIAWMIGVALILEYTLVVSAVAVGWSGYAAGFLKSVGLGLPDPLIQGPELGGVINLPAIFIIWVVAGLLIAGTRESATLNAVLVVLKMLALALFIAVALPVFNPEHFHPFMPYGFPRNGPSGSELGVMAAAAIIFFAFYGFDAIATAAEETKNPSRDLAIGIVGSMLVCVAIYMAVAAAAIGAVAYTGFANSPEPLALILREIGKPWAARILGASAVIALPTVILAFFFGQSRIFFTVARDEIGRAHV